MAPKPVTSPVPEDCYEATTSKRSRSIAKEVTIGGVASIFLGFGSLFLLLSTGVYV